MSRIHLQTLLVFLWAIFMLTPQLMAADLYVYGATAPVYQHPDQGQPPIHTLIYGDRITHTSTSQTPPSNGWVQGKVTTETTCIMGYAQSDTLLPVPTPDLSQSGFASLTRQLQKIGDAQVEQADDVTTVSQTFGHGVTLLTRTFHTAYGDFEEQQLAVSNISVNQGFLMARAIVTQDGTASENMARTPTIEKDAQGRLFVFDDSHWQIISVQQTPTGVAITFPERAD